MEIGFAAQVYRVEADYLEAFDNKRCFKVFHQQMREQDQEKWNHIATGTYLLVGTDSEGNVTRIIPFPNDEDYILVEEENPRRKKHEDDDSWLDIS